VKFSFFKKQQNSNPKDKKISTDKKYATMEEVENYYQQYSHYDLSKIFKKLFK